MKIEELENGRRYRLTRDVENPERDKRERYDPAKEAWSKGDVFRADVRDPLAVPMRVLWPVHLSAAKRRMINCIRGTHTGFDALVAALEPLPESAEDILEAAGASPLGVLEALLEGGALHPDRRIAAARLRAYAAAVAKAEAEGEER
jgi:hypothetical protein